MRAALDGGQQTATCAAWIHESAHTLVLGSGFARPLLETARLCPEPVHSSRRLWCRDIIDNPLVRLEGGLRFQAGQVRAESALCRHPRSQRGSQRDPHANSAAGVRPYAGHAHRYLLGPTRRPGLPNLGLAHSQPQLRLLLHHHLRRRVRLPVRAMSEVDCCVAWWAGVAYPSPGIRSLGASRPCGRRPRARL